MEGEVKNKVFFGIVFFFTILILILIIIFKFIKIYPIYLYILIYFSVIIFMVGVYLIMKNKDKKFLKIISIITLFNFLFVYLNSLFHFLPKTKSFESIFLGIFLIILGLGLIKFNDSFRYSKIFGIFSTIYGLTTVLLYSIFIFKIYDYRFILQVHSITEFLFFSMGALFILSQIKEDIHFAKNKKLYSSILIILLIIPIFFFIKNQYFSFNGIPVYSQNYRCGDKYSDEWQLDFSLMGSSYCKYCRYTSAYDKNKTIALYESTMTKIGWNSQNAGEYSDLDDGTTIRYTRAANIYKYSNVAIEFLNDTEIEISFCNL